MEMKIKEGTPLELVCISGLIILGKFDETDGADNDR